MPREPDWKKRARKARALLKHFGASPPESQHPPAPPATAGQPPAGPSPAADSPGGPPEFEFPEDFDVWAEANLPAGVNAPPVFDPPAPRQPDETPSWGSVDQDLPKTVVPGEEAAPSMPPPEPRAPAAPSVPEGEGPSPGDLMRRHMPPPPENPTPRPFPETEGAPFPKAGDSGRAPRGEGGWGDTGPRPLSLPPQPSAPLERPEGPQAPAGTPEPPVRLPRPSQPGGWPGGNVIDTGWPAGQPRTPADFEGGVVGPAPAPGGTGPASGTGASSGGGLKDAIERLTDAVDKLRESMERGGGGAPERAEAPRGRTLWSASWSAGDEDDRAAASPSIAGSRRTVRPRRDEP